MNVDLLTLSACNTAVGEKGADGAEVEGFGVLAQRRGAKGVLATLWPVADETTGIFMRNMYQLREEENLTKAEALQRTQIMFIHGEEYSKRSVSDKAVSKSGNGKDKNTNVSDGNEVVKESNEVTDNSRIAKGKDGIDRDKKVKIIDGKEGSDNNIPKRYIPNPDKPYAHPYFWAPFILMGNWR